MSQQINLFNPLLQPQKQILTARTMALALAVLAAGIGALASYGQMQTAYLRQEAAAGTVQLQKKQARLSSVNAEFAPRAKDRGIEREIGEAQAQLTALRNIAHVIERGELGDTDGYAGYFKALARQSLPGLWLTGVSVSGAGRDVSIRGRTTNPAMVPGYLNRLTQEPLMQGKAFASLSISQPSLPASGGNGVATPAPYVEFSLQSVPEELRK